MAGFSGAVSQPPLLVRPVTGLGGFRDWPLVCVVSLHSFPVLLYSSINQMLADVKMLKREE